MKKINYKNSLPYILSLSVLVAGIYSFYSVPSKEKVENQSITFLDTGFDTVVNFSSTCTSSEFEKYAQIVKDTFVTYNQYFDLYNEYDNVNNIYTLNHSNSPIKVDSPLLDCVQLAMQVHSQNHKFDICQGKLLHVWHTYREEGLELNNLGKDGHLPSQQELTNAFNQNGTLHITNNEIVLDENVQLDLGGIAKGYTAQKVKEILLENGCDNGYINAGGNVVLLSEKEDGSNWNIGIQSPDSSASLLSVQTKEPISLVTSGDYQRYYTIQNHKYGHIIDPDTKYPAHNFRSVTVLMEDSALADAYSTLLFCLDLDSGKQFAASHQIDVVWVMDLNKAKDNPDFTTKKYAIYCTDNLVERVKLDEH